MNFPLIRGVTQCKIKLSIRLGENSRGVNKDSRFHAFIDCRARKVSRDERAPALMGGGRESPLLLCSAAHSTVLGEAAAFLWALLLANGPLCQQQQPPPADLLAPPLWPVKTGQLGGQARVPAPDSNAGSEPVFSAVVNLHHTWAPSMGTIGFQMPFSGVRLLFMHQTWRFWGGRVDLPKRIGLLQVLTPHFRPSSQECRVSDRDDNVRGW